MFFVCLSFGIIPAGFFFFVIKAHLCRIQEMIVNDQKYLGNSGHFKLFFGTLNNLQRFILTKKKQSHKNVTKTNTGHIIL